MNVQDRFYLLAEKIEELTNPPIAIASTSNVVPLHDTGDVSVAKRRIKLPETSLPTFNGRCED